MNLLIHLPVFCVGLLKGHFDQFFKRKKEGMIICSSKATTFWTGLVAKKGCRWKKVVAIKFLADKWREKSSCLAAPCVAINLHWRLCLVLALALSDSFMCCTMYHTYLVSNSLVFLSFGNGFYFFFRNKHVQVLHLFFPKCLLSFRSFSALSQIDK